MLKKGILKVFTAWVLVLAVLTGAAPVLAGEEGVYDIIGSPEITQTAAAGTNITVTPMVAVGSHHMLALKADGTVWAWGNNTTNMLGVEATSSYITTPMRIRSLSDVIAISSSGILNKAALKSDGTIWTWGSNYIGQLGDGTRVAISMRTGG